MIKKLMKNQRLIVLAYIACMYFLLRHGYSAPNIDTVPVLVNLLLVLPAFGLLLLIFRNAPPAILIHSLMMYAVHYIDRVVYTGRLTHLSYSDLFAVRDGLRVAGRYNLAPTPRDVLLLVIVLIFNAACILAATRLSCNKKENALTGAVLLISSVLVIFLGTAFHWIPDPMESFDDNFDANNMAERKGTYYTLYGGYLHSRVEKPEGYSREEAERLLGLYSGDAGTSTEPISVIVIMNEALADYSLIRSTDFDDPLVNIHDPENGYFEGKLAVSVFGGRTCNSEYEFLTGNSLSFMPEDYVPYTQMIVGPTDSLTREMKALGMTADGIHPYYSQEWNRRNVYHFLGFDRLIAGEDFSTGLMDRDIENITDTTLSRLDFGADLEYIRGFISDAECYRKILSVLDEHGEGASEFVFAVTVQNHGGFDYSGEDFQTKEYVPGEPELNQYLTLSSISDAAFKDFTDVLEKRGRRTIVVMFGDHQPGLNYTLYSNKSSYLPDLFYVPYIVWSNFELAGNFPKETSVNYLSAFLKRNAGLPLTPWDRFRLEAFEFYPVMTGLFTLNRDFVGVRAEDKRTSEMLRKYEILQYARTFDR